MKGKISQCVLSFVRVSEWWDMVLYKKVKVTWLVCGPVEKQKKNKNHDNLRICWRTHTGWWHENQTRETTCSGCGTKVLCAPFTSLWKVFNVQLQVTTSWSPVPNQACLKSTSCNEMEFERGWSYSEWSTLQVCAETFAGLQVCDYKLCLKA